MLALRSIWVECSVSKVELLSSTATVKPEILLKDMLIDCLTSTESSRWTPKIVLKE